MLILKLKKYHFNTFINKKLFKKQLQLYFQTDFNPIFPYQNIIQLFLIIIIFIYIKLYFLYPYYHTLLLLLMQNFLKI